MHTQRFRVGKLRIDGNVKNVNCYYYRPMKILLTRYQTQNSRTNYPTHIVDELFNYNFYNMLVHISCLNFSSFLWFFILFVLYFRSQLHGGKNVFNNTVGHSVCQSFKPWGKPGIFAQYRFAVIVLVLTYFCLITASFVWNILM